MTLAEAADLLATKLHDTSGEMIANCKQWLQDTRYVMLNELNEWSFLEAEGSVTTVAGQSEYSFSTDFGEPLLRKLSMLKTSSGDLISLKTIEHLDALKDSDGTPRMGAVWGGSLRLKPTPTAADQLEWKGYLRVEDLADADSPEWERTFDIVWRLGAEAAGLEYLDDPRAAQKWALFFGTMKRMFGDNAIEDEEIALENFSGGSRNSIFRDDSGTAWP